MNLLQLFQFRKPGMHTIRYIIKGDADDYNVTFKCSEACKVIQEEHVRKGWKHTFSGQEGDYIYILAQANQPGSEVNVMIYEDGKLIIQESRQGDYPLVQLSAFVQ
jgi:hypothetical protein